jgi:hypothetical protein
MKPYCAKDLPPVHTWRDRFHYNPKTGAFTFVKATRSGWHGKQVGTFNNGYLQHKLNRAVTINVHRLIWAWVTGEWPGEETVIDHRNRDGLDNRWSNLRAATYQQNEANSRAKNKSGHRLKGAHLHKCGKWVSRIMVNYKEHYLGLYDTAEEASAVYYKAARKLFGPEWATKK